DCANRCYYGMMFTLKTLLEHQGKLSGWKRNELKEAETHKSLENGMKQLVSTGILDITDEANFEYVKDQRWKCDYSLYKFQKQDAEQCMNYVNSFYEKVESIINI
ncbi:MAG: HEPN domain-containing protein, partial [Lachnospiraceae bacterium]